jgi:hypothetical protein
MEKTPAAAKRRGGGPVGGGHVATTMPAMKMSSLEDEEEEEEDPGEPLLVLLSASSSSWISWSRQLALQNAFSPLQCKATQPESLRDITNHKFITRCQEQLLGSVGWLSGRMGQCYRTVQLIMARSVWTPPLIKTDGI